MPPATYAHEALSSTLAACREHVLSADFEPGDAGPLAEALAEAAADACLPDLEHACLLLREALGEDRTCEPALLGEWVEAMRTYAEAPGTPGSVPAFASLLGDPRLAAPLPAAEIEMLVGVLTGAAPGEAVAPAVESPCGGTPAHDPGAHDLHPQDAPPLPEGVEALVELLRQELEPLGALVNETLADPTTDDAAEHLAEQVECFGAAAQAAGLTGLHLACAQLTRLWQALDASTLVELEPVLRTSHGALASYVEEPFRQPHGARLTDCLAARGSPVALDVSEAQALRAALDDPGTLDELVEPMMARGKHASAEMVSLDLPDDVAPELLETLLEELPTLTDEFSRTVDRMARGGTVEDVNVAQRVAHTLKGAANTVGVAGVANLTHHVEDVLRAFFDRSVLPGPAVIRRLLRVSDCLASMSEAMGGIGSPPADALEVLQDMLDLANRIDAEGIAGLSDEDGTQAPCGPTPDDATRGTTRPATTAPEEAAAQSALVRVPAPLIDEFMRLTGETIILTGQVQERMQGTLDGMRSMQAQFGALQQLGYELEQLIDLGGAALASARANNDSHFDPLELDEYNELHSLTRRMVEASTDAREIGRGVEQQVRELITMLGDQGRLNRESHERVLETRMVPVKTIVPRLERAARQAARATEKEIEIVVSGVETRMDSEVLTEIADPLMHLLRNAVDHGIESGPERAARGKGSQGRITLDFSRAGNQVQVRCADDGAGLDLDAVRATAIARGRIAPDNAPSEESLHRMILEPGFSTRDRATHVSGRGIGLDAVYSKVVELGGTFEMRSDPGRGCSIEIGVPLTLISTHAVLVRVRKDIYALSSRGIEQILHPDAGALEELAGGALYRTGEEIHSATLLDSLLVLPADARTSDREPRTAIITQSERGRVAIMVQEVIDSRDLVVKSLGRFVPKVRGIVGATILGNGAITPVLDLPDLLRTARREIEPGSIERRTSSAEPQAAVPTALVVDDSLSARRALARVMSDSGYGVRTARDGVEALQIMEGLRPDVLLVDMEMPRMNGLELVTHLRASVDDGPRIPVVMVTSRSTVKHRQQAEQAGVDIYMTKPFSEDELLDHVDALRRSA